MAGPIWRSTLLAGLKGQANQPFTAPSSVTRLLICASNGLRAVGGGTEGTYQEYFLNSMTPSGTCEVPKAPVDSDNDGVIDENDACANTPAGTTVDDKGCPVEEDDDEEPIVKDSDGDGVPDELDKCANTPTGTVVDATGCPVAANGNGSGANTGAPVNTRLLRSGV